MFRNLVICSVCILFVSISGTEAQILDRMVRRTVQKAEDRIIERASDAIAEALARKVYRELDKTFREAYEKRDTSGAGVDSVDFSSYGEFLKSLDRSADVPPSYNFDLLLDVVITDKGKKEQPLKYYFNKSSAAFGIEQSSEKDGKSLFILDMERDIMVVYQEKNGEKTASAMPSMMQLAGAMAKSYTESENLKITVEKTGKSKSVAGYSCEEYKMTWDEGHSLAYVTNDMEYSFPAAFGKMLQQFYNSDNAGQIKQIDGMALESISFDKKGKEDSRWLTQKVEQGTFNIDNGAYTFRQFAAEE